MPRFFCGYNRFCLRAEKCVCEFCGKSRFFVEQTIFILRYRTCSVYRFYQRVVGITQTSGYCNTFGIVFTPNVTRRVVIMPERFAAFKRTRTACAALARKVIYRFFRTSGFFCDKVLSYNLFIVRVNVKYVSAPRKDRSHTNGT